MLEEMKTTIMGPEFEDPPETSKLRGGPQPITHLQSTLISSNVQPCTQVHIGHFPLPSFPPNDRNNRSI